MASENRSERKADFQSLLAAAEERLKGSRMLVMRCPSPNCTFGVTSIIFDVDLPDDDTCDYCGTKLVEVNDEP